MTTEVWTVRLSTSAESDYRQILHWTKERFGLQQARAYANTLSSALQALSAGPAIIGVTKRPEIAANILTLHVARNEHKGRHFIMFRVGSSHGENVVDVLRLLHDSMELQRHVPTADDA